MEHGYIYGRVPDRILCAGTKSSVKHRIDGTPLFMYLTPQGLRYATYPLEAYEHKTDLGDPTRNVVAHRLL